MKRLYIIPIVLGFFVMGFVDVVGISTNYIQKDFNLSDSMAGMLPMAVFLWFLLCSIPTGILMNKYGKKAIVIFSMLITLFAMLLPILSYSYLSVLISFALLGIGNTALQVSLSPLVASVVSKEALASTLTWGQFIKAISSFLGPIIAAAMAHYTSQWKLIFVIYAIITLISILCVHFYVTETKTKVEISSFHSTLSLFSDKFILSLFIGILFLVGIDVSLNVSIPRILIERFNKPVEEAGLGTSLYFFARTGGTFLGAFLLAKYSPAIFFRISMILAIIALLVFSFCENIMLFYIMIIAVGMAFANVFSIIFSSALNHNNKRANDISALMVMGISGGAIFPSIMGFMSDFGGQLASLMIIILAAIYLLYISFIKHTNTN